MTEATTSSEVPPEVFDDSISLESKVLLALSRLQNRKTLVKKTPEAKAVSCKSVVQFLKANYSWLDGDIQSQVMTVLLSFVKIGIVCILDNEKYLLLVPNSKTMNSICVTRTSHGPQCCCLFTLKTSSRFCCCLKDSVSQKNKGNARKKRGQRNADQAKCGSTCGRNLSSTAKKRIRTKCSSGGKEQSRTERTKKRYKKCVEKPEKCPYCFQVHPEVDSDKTCETCNPNGSRYSVPFDIFSPRDEVMGVVELAVDK